MKKKILLLFCLLFSMQLFAGPAFPEFATIIQSDGSQLSFRKCGNEYFSYFITLDGIVLSKKSNGDFCYAEITTNNEIKSTNIIAHNQESRSFYEEDLVKGLNKYINRAELAEKKTRSTGFQEQASVRSIGSPTIPILLIEFTDQKFRTADAVTFYDKHFNAKGYTESDYTGSVRDYFVDQSDGQFQPHFKVVGKVMVSHTYYYYGSNTGGYNKDYRFGLLAQEAITKAIEAGADFSVYDSNSFAFIYAGLGEQYIGADEGCIWAKTMFNYTIKANKNKTFNSFSGINELSLQMEENKLEGIGLFCHEFSHLLGLPDFYGPGTSFGLSRWSLMDEGCFNNYSKTPMGYNAYERSYLGWITPTVLQPMKQMVTLKDLNSKDRTVYKILNPHDKTGNEYYLLENRQPTSPWYASMYGSGMLVYHIDFHASTWNSNTVNSDVNHPRVTIIPADGVLSNTPSSSAFKGDPYPGLSNNTELTSFTTPCDIAYKGTYMDIVIRNITEHEGVIRFAYMADGILEPTKEITVEDVTCTSLKAMWSAVEHAEKYALTLMDGDTEISRDTVTSNAYHFTKLLSEHHYTIHIKALATTYIESKPFTAIFKTNAPLSIDALLTERPNSIATLYSMNGTYLRDMPLWHVTQKNAIGIGVYLMVVNGNRYKIKIGN
ncbi:MAG: M6 family metalloprotease domain-containing protein [Bacteroidaceae bacterium]